MEKIINYILTGSFAILVWNIILYFLKRRHSKTDKKNDEKIIELNKVLKKTIEIRNEVSSFLHENLKDLISLHKELALPIKDDSELKDSAKLMEEKIKIIRDKDSKEEFNEFLESAYKYDNEVITKMDELSKNLEFKANELLKINLNSIKIKKNIISKHSKLPYLIRKHIINRKINSGENFDTNNIKNIEKILLCSYELEDLINEQLKKL